MIDDLDDLLDAAETPHSPDAAKPAQAAAAAAGEGPASWWKGTARTAAEAWAGLQRALKNRTGTPAPWRSPVEGMQTNAAASEAERMAFGNLGLQVTTVAAFTQLAQAEARAESHPGRALHVPQGEAATGDTMQVASAEASATPDDGYATKAYAIGTTIIPTAYLLPIGMGGAAFAQGSPAALVLGPSIGRPALPDSPVLPGLMAEMPAAIRIARAGAEPEPHHAAEARPVAGARAPAEAEAAGPIARIHSPAEKPNQGSPSRPEEEQHQAIKPQGEDAEHSQAPSEGSAPLPRLRADDVPSSRPDMTWQDVQPSKVLNLSASLERGQVAPDPSRLLGPALLDDGSILGTKLSLDLGDKPGGGRGEASGSGSRGTAQRQQDGDADHLPFPAQGTGKEPGAGNSGRPSGPTEGARDRVETKDHATADSGPLVNGHDRDSGTATGIATSGERPHPLADLVQAVAGLVLTPDKDATGGGRQGPSAGPGGGGKEASTAALTEGGESGSGGSGNGNPHGGSGPRDPQRAEAATGQDTTEAPQASGPGGQSAEHRPESHPASPAATEAPQAPGLAGQLAGLLDPRPDHPATTEAPTAPEPKGQSADHRPASHPASPDGAEAPQARGPGQGDDIPAAPAAPPSQHFAEAITVPTPEDPARMPAAGHPVPDDPPGLLTSSAPGRKGGEVGNDHRPSLADGHGAKDGPDTPHDLPPKEGAQPGPAIAAQPGETGHPSHAGGPHGTMVAEADLALAQDVLEQLPALLAGLGHTDHDVGPEGALPDTPAEPPILAALPADLVPHLSDTAAHAGDLVLL
jgi:hypothetical protein